MLLSLWSWNFQCQAGLSFPTTQGGAQSMARLGGLCFSTTPRALSAPKIGTFPIQFPSRNSVQPWPFHIQQTLSSHIPSSSLLACFPAVPSLVLSYPLCALVSFWQTCGFLSQIYLNPLDEWVSFHFLIPARLVFWAFSLFFQDSSHSHDSTMPGSEGSLGISAGKESPSSLKHTVGTAQLLCQARA